MEKKLTQQNLEKVVEKETTPYRSIVVRHIGNDYKLLIEKTTKTIEVYSDEKGREIRKDCIETNTKSEVVKLSEISNEKLKDLRKNNIPTFVYKTKGKLYYARLTESINVCAFKGGHHQCSSGSLTCKRLNPLSDEKGGCKKVRFYSNLIEELDFITEGVEVFNAGARDAMMVIQCKNKLY